MPLTTVPLRTGFASADLKAQGGNIAIRPVSSYVCEDGHGVPHIVTEQPVVATSSEDGEIVCEVVPSDDAGWRTTGPVPYRVTEYVYGSRRSYVVLVPGGVGAVDLVALPKYRVPDAPPRPEPVVRGSAPGGARSDHMIQVVARFCDSGGAHAEGAVVFRPMQPSERGGERPLVITRSPVVETPLVEGALDVRLVASDDPEWMVEAPVVYRIMEIVGGRSATWCAPIYGPGPVDLADIRTGAPCTSTVMTGRQ